MFKPRERVRLGAGAFTGIEGIYQITDGEHRAMVLIEFLSNLVRVSVAPSILRRTS